MIIWLLFAHGIGDVFLRSRFISTFKAKSILVLAFHCYMYVCCVSVVLVYFDVFAIWKFIFLLVGHFLIDSWKHWVDLGSNWMNEEQSEINLNKYVIIDQGLHMLQLFIVGSF